MSEPTVKPDRDTIYNAAHTAVLLSVEDGDQRGLSEEMHRLIREEARAVTDAVLAADPRRTEAQVAADALDEAAKEAEWALSINANLRLTGAELALWLRDRAARIRAGGAS